MGIVRSSDGGENWSYKAFCFAHNVVYDASDTTYAYSGQALDRGLWRSSEGAGIWTAHNIVTGLGDQPPVSTGAKNLRRVLSAPNPFLNETVLRLSPAGEGGLILGIYDVTGSLVRKYRWAGAGPVFWDGRDSRGRRAGQGIYLIRALVGGEIYTGKVVYLR